MQSNRDLIGGASRLSVIGLDLASTPFRPDERGMATRASPTVGMRFVAQAIHEHVG